MGYPSQTRDIKEDNSWGEIQISNPRTRPKGGLIRRVKDWSSTEFIFSSTSHTLGADERKEYAMNAIAITIIFLIRVVVPLVILLTLGEWMRRRDVNYWTRM